MEKVYTRKMASVQEVNGVYPIEGADKICQYGIQGWRVVDQVGKYKVGDLVVFAEVDSWVPATIAPFLSKGKEPRVYNGIPGEKLRTIRLRKALSQGLLLPLTVLDHVESELFVGLDVSFPLGIVKWEAPPEFTSADAKGNFPSFIIKTDQERCVSGDTIVNTDAGSKTIKEIVDEKLAVKVKSFNHETNQVEFKEVTDWSVMTRKKNAWLKITTNSGKEFLVTKNHRVWVENLQCYRLAEDLFVGDCVTIVNKTDK